jgi:hypothetical protein
MTDEELQTSWPDLGAVVAELRRIDATLADRLVDAVQYSSTSGELYSGSAMRCMSAGLYVRRSRPAPPPHGKG